MTNTTAGAANGRQGPGPARQRVLIIEDEPLIAFDLEGILNDAGGFEVAGLAGSLDEALALATGCACDAAILDLNLGGAHSGPVAVALRARGVPFVALSGYARAQAPESFADVPFLEKPVRPAALVAVLRSLARRGD